MTEQEMPICPTARLAQVRATSHNSKESFEITGVIISATTIDRAINTVASWMERDFAGKLVAFVNVHMLTEAYWKPQFMSILQHTDLNCPDGMPLVWLGRLGMRQMGRVSGPDFMPTFCVKTANKGYRHFFYGGMPGIAEKAIAKLRESAPDLQVAGWYSPPYRELSALEDEAIVNEINQSGADVVWVCLGCPKQEIWMAQHKSRLNAKVILAVGMAFDILAGSKSRAPWLLRASGLEWLYRLASEPRRLAGRYLSSNFTFLYMLTHEAITGRRIYRSHS
jgi:N-acetylglucosaminyldiphosphoundecaprenol N-acetyl-beta-D-mannosaminyltransferase